jgi:hypothetical protein
MGRLRTALAVVAAVLIVAAGVWITIKAVDKDPALFGSVVAAAVAFGLAVAQRRWEKRQELERLHRDEMAPIYEQLVDRLKDEEKMAATAENAEFFKELTTKLLVHGSPPVIKAWIGWRETGTPQSPEDLRLVLAWEGVLRTIRADLGHDDSSLAYGDLLRVYINDVDEALAKTSGRRRAVSRPRCSRHRRRLRSEQSAPRVAEAQPVLDVLDGGSHLVRWAGREVVVDQVADTIARVDPWELFASRSRGRRAPRSRSFAVPRLDRAHGPHRRTRSDERARSSFRPEPAVHSWAFVYLAVFPLNQP